MQQTVRYKVDAFEISIFPDNGSLGVRPFGDADGSRGSTGSQRSYGELAPTHAAGKVPVPLGRDCQWETTGPWLVGRQ